MSGTGSRGKMQSHGFEGDRGTTAYMVIYSTNSWSGWSRGQDHVLVEEMVVAAATSLARQLEAYSVRVYQLDIVAAVVIGKSLVADSIVRVKGSPNWGVKGNVANLMCR